MPGMREGERQPFLPGLLVALGVFAWAAALYHMKRLNADPDLFTHIAWGRYIAQHGIVSRDMLSWTGLRYGLPSTPHEWLYDLITYRAWQAAGYQVLYLAAAALAACVPLLVFLLARRRCGRPLTALIAAAVALLALVPVIAPRPQLVTYCLLLVCALLMERKWWWAVLPVYVLAINLHGATYPLYLALITYYCFREKPRLLLAASAATLLTPIGAALYVYPFKTVLTVQAVPITEMQRPGLLQYPLHYVLLLLAALVLARRGVPWSDRAFAIVFGLFSVTALRQMIWFPLLVVPMLTPHVHQPRTARAPAPALLPSAAYLFDGALIGVLGVAGVLFAVAALSMPLHIDRGYPAAAAAYMRARRMTRVLNQFDQGGYLLLAGPRPFIDGRYEPFAAVYNGGRDLMGEYVEVAAGRAPIEPFLSEYGIDSLLLPVDSPLFREVRERRGFERVFEAEGFAVFTYHAVAVSSPAQTCPLLRLAYAPRSAG